MEVLHFWNDISVLLAFLGEILRDIASGITEPVSYVYNFLVSFSGTATGSGTATTTATITETFGDTGTTSAMRIFNKLPYWNILTTILGVAILILGTVAIIKLFNNAL